MFFLELVDLVWAALARSRSDEPEERAQLGRHIGCLLVTTVPIFLALVYVFVRWLAHTAATDGY